MNTGVIVQARMTSTRLPGKVLRELPYGSGVSVLEQVIDRLTRARKIDTIIIATTINSADDKIVDITKKKKVSCFRGSETDVLSRYYLAAKKNRLDIVVRVTSDCPCIDPEIVDLIITEHVKQKVDYTANSLDKTYPHGLDAEVFNFDVLEHAYKNAKKDYDKEHVTPYIRMHFDIFKILSMRAPVELNAPDIRITLDTEEDYSLLCCVYDYLYSKNKYFNAYDVVSLFKTKPWLKLINKKIMEKKIFDLVEDEICEAIRVLELQDLKKSRDILRRHVAGTKI